ncbi:Phytochrome [Thalictrum thalictroides]|uniref:Phytochrome n=1 Tax=Thalictrum thalictroides TaxID=46969 RepID=A0A7J6WCS1_THATH|nr:Phytochrome [Thalictrum thalictroides]
MSSGSNKRPFTNNNTITTTATNQTESVNKAIAQFTVDARLHAVFEESGESGKPFDYSQSVRSTTSQSVPEQQITAYLSKIQRGGHIQPFGCMIAVDDSSFRVIAFSENATEMLDLTPQSVPTLDKPQLLDVGTDVRTLFTQSSVGLLEKAFSSREITLLNPVWVHSKNSGKPFYAILHRIDVAIVIDLEPARTEDPALSIAGAVQSQKLAVRAISRLQSLPGGDIKILCDTVVEHVRNLTGYDRVMVYKFHDDEHGEVVAESKCSNLEPYIGLHYPATDIPQASRFLFKQNRVRMIVDCHATPVRVIQDEALMQPLCLVGSTLRAPHGCHAQYMANMGSIASLALAVINNGNDEEGTSGRNPMKLWGLVVCHHTSPRCIPFPLRHACEFLMQAFGLQLNMELQLASQLLEKHVLRTQTLLCDMLLRDSPTGIVTQSPSIMDLVKCDGSALYYKGKYYPIGVTPTETQMKDIVDWLWAYHGDSTGLSTDSLADAGYPGAASLGDAVCGMAVAYISSRDFLFWFRSNTAKEIKWGGAKHHPDAKDDGQNLHPRSSFKAFLEVVKSRSLPWENAEMDAIHSLQLILRDSFRDVDGSNSKPMITSPPGDLEMQGVELSSVAREMVRLIETATAPIFAVDSDGRINGWNAKVAELTGLSVGEAMGKSLVHDLVFKESIEVVDNLLNHALRGEEDKNVEIKLRKFNSQKTEEAIFVIVNACSSRDYTNNIVGACFVGQDVTGQKVVMDKFIRIQGDYKAIVHNLNPLIPPIFASDENTCCSEWNTAMEKLTGWDRGEIMGKMLVGEVFGGCCRLKGPDSLTKFMIVLHSAIGGQDTHTFPFAFFNRDGKYVQALLTANKRANLDGQIIGVFCFLQIASPELQQSLEIQRQQEKKCFARVKELAYICQEIKNPLSGIRFTNTLLEATDLTEDQKQFLETSAACERQMMKIIKDVDLQNIEDGTLELEKVDFLLGSVINAVVSQVMILLRERSLQLIRDIPEEIKTFAVSGDQVRIQQVLADFLLNMVRYAPCPDGWVEIQVRPNLKQSLDGIELVHLEFRMEIPVLKQNGVTFPNCIPTSSSVCGDDMGILQLLNGRMDNPFTANKVYESSIAETAIVLDDDENVQSPNLEHLSSLNTHMANQQTLSGGREKLWADVLSISRDISERMETSNNTDTPSDAIDLRQENMKQSASKSDADFYGPFKKVWKEGADVDLSRPFKKVWTRGATKTHSLIKACHAKEAVNTDAHDIFSFPDDAHDVSLTTRKGKRKWNLGTLSINFSAHHHSDVMEAENSKVIGFPNPHAPTGQMKEPLCSTEVKGMRYQSENVLERKRRSTGERGKRRQTKTPLPFQTRGIQYVNQLIPDDTTLSGNASIQSYVSPQSSDIVKSLFLKDSTAFDDQHQYDCARREESVDFMINTFSSPMKQDEMPVLLQDRSSLFVKESIFWESIESNEVFQLMPQRPHFDPLKQYSEWLREGFALGMMVNFVKLVEMTLKATPDEPRCMFENTSKALTDLEKHGFTVQPIQNRLKELLSIKDRYTKLNDNSKITEREFIERQERITQLKIKLRTLTMEVEVEGSRVAELQKTLNEINKSIQIVRLDFRSKVASPLVST